MRWRGSGADEGEESSTTQDQHHLSNSNSSTRLEDALLSSSSSDEIAAGDSSSEEEKKQDAQITTTVDNDDGGDHAEEATPPWKPQQEETTCEFTHTISGYAQKRESGCKKAEYSATKIDEFGNRWRLIVYVNGNGRASNHHLSLFLQVADAEELPFGWKKAVSYVLTLEHPKGDDYTKRNPDKTFKLCPKAIDWGWSQFITSDRIQQEGFVENDSLTVRASVTVKSSSVSIDEEDAELYLKCAVEEGDVEAVKLCLANGASVNCQFKDDLYSPLHTACSVGSASQGSMDVLNLLLKEGANGNACNKWRESPLLIAANNGHRSAVEALLSSGADPSLCSEAGWSALTFAAHKGFDDIVDLLIKADAPVDSPVTEDDSTPLHKACAGTKEGHLEAVKLLIDAGADVHALNKWRETPLLTAANHGQAGAVEALLEAGADPCRCTDTGWSPLSIAAYKGHDDVVRLLLEEDAPTEEDDPTLSALLQAATKGLPDTVELLLQYGADHTVTTKKGDTALSILVEQNLIDAAVEMVTEYNASIPRCSRDRKKVQRARLLINLRMKQMEREICSDNGGDDHSVDDDLQAEEAVNDRPKQRKKRGEAKNRKKADKSSKQSAEERARAAEEALLLELEEEETKAKKDQAEANNKRQRKKEKKERERQQKLEEELARKAQEEKELAEQERLRKEKEELARRERQRRLLAEQEKERAEFAEQQRLLAAKRKQEKEQKQQREKDHRKKTQKISTPQPPPQSAVGRRVTALKQKGGSEPGTPNRNGLPVLPPKVPTPVPSNRRWEKLSKQKSPIQSPASSSQTSQIPTGSSSPAPIPLPSTEPNRTPTAPKTILTPRSAPPYGTDHSLPSSPTGLGNTSSSDQSPLFTPLRGVQMGMLRPAIEHPAISLFRKEKVLELKNSFRQMLPKASEIMFNRVLSRWSLRAAHDVAAVIDPIIPSWTEDELLVSFFQRQLIGESRRVDSGLSGTDMGKLKEAGSGLSAQCQKVAHDLHQYRQTVDQNLPKDWTDTALGMTVSEASFDSTGSATIVVSWANRGQVCVPSEVFSSLCARHIGPSSRFLASCFMSKTIYDTWRLVTKDTPMELRLSPRTKSRLKAVGGVSAEMWSDPFNADASNVFWGSLQAADAPFGGQLPFSRDPSSEEKVLGVHGGSLVVFLPPDASTASKYVHQMLHLLTKTQETGAALSFAVFAHSDCFVGSSEGPTIGDLQQLDVRLSGDLGRFVRCTEVLPPGRHEFVLGGGVGRPYTCSSRSLFFVLQNEGGNSCFNFSSDMAREVTSSMLPKRATEDPSSVSIGFSPGFPLQKDAGTSRSSYFEAAMDPISPDPQRVVRSDFGAIGGEALPQPFSPASGSLGRGASRRGRLFDLVDNGEEEADVDVVSGMLNTLDVGLFQGTSLGSEIDIEAISLMGIGGSTSSGNVHPGQPQQGRLG